MIKQLIWLPLLITFWLAPLSVPLALAQTSEEGEKVPASALDQTKVSSACEGITQSKPGSGSDCGDGDVRLVGIFENILTVMSFVVGAIAVLMIIIGAIRYVVSAGDPAGAKGAKDTILFALIGLVIAFMARAIVVFVLNAAN